MPETASSKYLDGAGVGYLWKQVKGYVDGNVENLSTPLPIPVCTVEPGSGSSAIIKLSNTFTGYGNVTVRYRLGAEPSASDSALDLILEVTF